MTFIVTTAYKRRPLLHTIQLYKNSVLQCNLDIIESSTCRSHRLTPPGDTDCQPSLHRSK